MKRKLLDIIFLVVVILLLSNNSFLLSAQSNYKLEQAIPNFSKDASVFQSNEYGWTFLKSKTTPYRYFYRLNDSTQFIELLDPNEYLKNSPMGFDGFNANPYQGVKFGSSFIPNQFGFITASNLYSSPNVGRVITVDFRTNTILKTESGTLPLKEIIRFIKFDNSIYFRGRSDSLFTAVYKLANNNWELTSGKDFFNDYEVGNQFIFDEENDRLVMSTGLTFVRDGLWAFKNSSYSELNTNNQFEFDLSEFVGFIYSSPQDKGTPVLYGRYQTNDSIGSEMFRLDGGVVNLITNASPNNEWTQYYKTVFNDRFDLLIEASLTDSLKSNNTYTSKKGRGIYKLNTTNNRLERLSHLTDNIYSVSHAVRTSDGIYLSARNSATSNKYYVYLYKNNNPVLEKIDLKGEYLEGGGLFVSDDKVYFVSNRGICKIVNSQFENFYLSADYWGVKKNEIVWVNNNQVYLNYYFDHVLYVLFPEPNGLNEVNKEYTLNVYPNPSTGHIHLQTSILSKNVEIKIYNSQAQLVYISSRMVQEIDMSHYPKGVYHIQVKTEKVLLTQNLLLN